MKDLFNEFIISILNEVADKRPAIPSEEDIINAIFPNAWAFVAHIIATIILLSFIIYFVWKPTKKYLERRKKTILKNVEEVEEKNKLANKNFELSKSELLESKEVASQIVHKASLEAENIKTKIENNAIKKADFIQKEAFENIKKNEQEALLRVNKEASILALETAEILLSKKMNDEENQKMVDDIIKNLQKEKEVK